MNSRTRKIFFAAVALLCAALLRETGHLRLQWYRLDAHGEHLTEISFFGQEVSGDKAARTRGSSTTNTTQDDEDSAWGWGFSTTGGLGDVPRAGAAKGVVWKRGPDTSHLFRLVREHLGARIADVNSREVLVNRVRMSGPYWTPLHKEGRCAYSVSLAESGRGFQRTASVTGEIAFSVSGFCSVRELEALMAQKIGTQIEKSLEELAKKP